MRKNQLLTLFFNGIQKEYRSKTFLVMLLLTVVTLIMMSAGANFANNFIQDKTGEMIKGIPGVDLMELFYRMISIWSGILAAFFGVNSIKSDYDYNVLDQIWSFPIRKIDYLITRLITSWIIVISYFIISLGLGLIIFKIGSQEVQISFGIWRSLSIDSLFMLATIIISALYSLLVPKTLAFICTFFTSVIISIANYSFINFTITSETFKNITATKVAGLIMHYTLPRLGTLSQISKQMLTGELSNNLTAELAHFGLTLTIIVLLLYKIIKRQGA